MARRKRESGKDSFDLIPEKQGKLNDDRSYCAALLAWALSEKRAERVRNKRRTPDSSIINKIQMTKAKQLDKKFG